MVRIKCGNVNCTSPNKEFLWDETQFYSKSLNVLGIKLDETKNHGVVPPHTPGAVRCVAICSYCGWLNVVWLKQYLYGSVVEINHTDVVGIDLEDVVGIDLEDVHRINLEDIESVILGDVEKDSARQQTLLHLDELKKPISPGLIPRSLLCSLPFKTPRSNLGGSSFMGPGNACPHE